jgi:lipopolysaccharide heptosyltransferase II
VVPWPIRLKFTSNLGGKADCERVLVIRFSSLGDILLAAPAVRALRKRFPDAHIDLLVASEYADAAAMIPGPDRILGFDRSLGLRGLLKLRSELSRRYTYLVDLQNSVRSAFLRASTFPTVWAKARRYRFKRWLLVQFKWNLYGDVIPIPIRYLHATETFGAEDDGDGLNLVVPLVATAEADALIENFGFNDHPIALLCPGARHFTKRWPADRWIAVGQQLREERFRVVVAGAKAEESLIHSITASIPSSVPLVGFPVPTVGAFIRRCKVVVSNDSGLMHLAAGMNVPLVAIFGPTVAEFGFFPFRTRSKVIEQSVPSRPCSAMGTEVCREGHFRCMLDTQPQDVVRAIHDLISAG